MRYTVTRQRIQIIGRIWMPMGALCAQVIDLGPYQLANIEDPTDRESVEDWLTMNTGDFSHVVDFRADFHIGDENIVHEWANGDESECAFYDAMYPGEDD